MKLKTLYDYYCNIITYNKIGLYSAAKKIVVGSIL